MTNKASKSNKSSKSMPVTYFVSLYAPIYIGAHLCKYGIRISGGGGRIAILQNLNIVPLPPSFSALMDVHFLCVSTCAKSIIRSVQFFFTILLPWRKSLAFTYMLLIFFHGAESFAWSILFRLTSRGIFCRR